MDNKKNIFLADLLVGYVNLHNLHFNVKGPGFKYVHEYLEGLYDQVHAIYDEVAEKMRMDEEIPVTKVSKYLELTQVKELEEKEWTTKEAFEQALKLFEYFRNMAHEIRKEADANDDYPWVSMLEDIISGLDKEIWMMRENLK